MSTLRQQTTPTLDFTPDRVGSIAKKTTQILGFSLAFYAVLLILMAAASPALAGKAIFWIAGVGIMTFILPGAPALFFALVNFPGWLLQRLNGRSEKLEKLFSNFYFDSKKSEIVVKSVLEEIRLPIELLVDFQHSKTSENLVYFHFADSADRDVCQAIRDENLRLKPSEFEKAFFALRAKAVS